MKSVVGHWSLVIGPGCSSRLHSGRRRRQWHTLLGHINHESASLQSVPVSAVGAGGIPYCSDFDLLIALRDLGWLTALLLDVGLDHLSGNSSRELAVFSAFEQYRNHDFRIPPWGHAHEPGIVLVFGLAIGGLGLERIADRLRASGLTGKIDALQM